MNRESLTLVANAMVVVESQSRKNITRARRYDVFSLMYYRPNSKMEAATYDAVRRFQADLAVLHQTQGAIDAIRTCARGGAWLTQGFALSRVEAGERLAGVLTGMEHQWARQLILALTEQEVVYGRAPNHHAIVLRVTGELDRASRTALIRQAAEELAASYAVIDNQPRRATG